MGHHQDFSPHNQIGPLPPLHQLNHHNGYTIRRISTARLQNSFRFLGIFTATHLSICLLVAGFGLFVVGLMTVAGVNLIFDGDAKRDEAKQTFRSVGVALLVFGSVLIVIAIGVFIAAFKWAKHRVHTFKAPFASTMAVLNQPSPQQQVATINVPPNTASLIQRRVSVPGSTVEMMASQVWPQNQIIQNPYMSGVHPMLSPINPHSSGSPSAPMQMTYDAYQQQATNAQHQMHNSQPATNPDYNA